MKSLLILDFVDNILDKHNCYSCKSNITFFHYLICHIYPKNIYKGLDKEFRLKSNKDKILIVIKL